MASASFKISSDGGATYAAVDTSLADALALAYVASSTYSIKAKLDSPAGVNLAQWEIVSADDANIASLPTVTPDNNEKSCTFSVPKTGGAWILKVTCSDGVAAPITNQLSIKVLPSSGFQLIAIDEEKQSHNVHGWCKAYNDLARGAATSTPGTSASGVIAIPWTYNGGTLTAGTTTPASAVCTRVENITTTPMDGVGGAAAVGYGGSTSYLATAGDLTVTAGGASHTVPLSAFASKTPVVTITPGSATAGAGTVYVFWTIPQT